MRNKNNKTGIQTANTENTKKNSFETS